jgi:hypothetical protein
MEKRKLPSLVSMLIMTLITCVVWGSFEIYRVFNKPTTPSVPPSVSEPLSPTLDQETVSLIQNKIYLSDEDIPDDVINTSVVGTRPAATPVPEPEEESVNENSDQPLEESENATGSAEQN